MYQIDPATGKTLARSGAATAFGAPMQDMAALEYYAANNEQLLLGVYGAYLLGPNTAEANSFTSGWNLASYLSQYTQASKFVAVTNYGASQGDSGVEEMLLGLTDSGYLWALIYRGTTSIGLNFFETTLPALDYPTYNGIQNCSLTVADDGSLVLSYFTGESNEIYLLVPMSDGEDIVFKATRVGDFGADVWPASILSATVNGVEGAATKEQVLEYASAAEPMTATAEALEAADYVAPTKVAMKASGSLNTATAYRAPAAQLPAVPMGGTMTAEGDVTVNITADEDTTNGMMEITWDPALMTYASANCAAQLSSVNASEGKLTLGYASQAVIAKDAVLATLTFKAVGEATCDLSVQVKTVERNEQSGLEETVTLTIDRDAAAHVWSEWQVTKEADCFHDGEETRTCSHCDAVETRKIPANSDHCPSEAFTDVNTDLWYHEGVDFVVKNGYMKGMSDTVFGVDGELTRAQLATILYRVAGSPSTEGMENPFTDVAEGIWYEDAIKWAANCGVVNGVTETTFAPEDSVTREQIATMLYRYENQKKTSGAGLDSFPDGGQVSDWAVEAMGWAVTNGFINGITESDGKIYLQPQATATRAQIATILMRYLEAD